jgi:hypothetical protein
MSSSNIPYRAVLRPGSWSACFCAFLDLRIVAIGILEIFDLCNTLRIGRSALALALYRPQHQFQVFVVPLS